MSLRDNAKNLRNHMTKEERRLWYDFLKRLPFPVKRQAIIRDFIVDFYIPSRGIVIELDGSQHYEREAQRKDAIRDQTLQDLGLTVLRYPNSDVNEQFDSVCRDILLHCGMEI